jgi:hypothetical protein
MELFAKVAGIAMFETVAEELQYVKELSMLTDAEWVLSDTGGACSCAELRLDTGDGIEDHYLLVTATADPSIPSPDEPHTLGEYLQEGISPNWWYFANRAEMVDFLRVWLGKRGN